MGRAAYRAAWSTSPGSIVGGVRGDARPACSHASLRRRVGLVGSHHVRHRRHPDPGADQARLLRLPPLRATSAELGVIIPPSIPMILRRLRPRCRSASCFIAASAGALIGDSLMLVRLLQSKGLGAETRRRRPHALRYRAAKRAGRFRCTRRHPVGGICSIFRPPRPRPWPCSTRSSWACDLPRDRHQDLYFVLLRKFGAVVGGDHVHHRQRGAIRLPHHARACPTAIRLAAGCSSPRRTSCWA